jgi:hypothetical protein
MVYGVWGVQDTQEALIIDLIGDFESCAYEPSERDAGLAFNDDLYDLAKKTIRENKASFINHDQRSSFLNELEEKLGTSGYSCSLDGVEIEVQPENLLYILEKYEVRFED